jgi:hypothetical protein
MTHIIRLKDQLPIRDDKERDGGWGTSDDEVIVMMRVGIYPTIESASLLMSSPLTAIYTEDVKSYKAEC